MELGGKSPSTGSPQAIAIASTPWRNGGKTLEVPANELRHARACRGHPRLLSHVEIKDVDGRDKSAMTVDNAGGSNTSQRSP